MGGEGPVTVGMSLVINRDFGLDRISCVYAGSESRKSTENSSKVVAISGRCYDSVFLDSAEHDGEMHGGRLRANLPLNVAYLWLGEWTRRISY